MVCRVHHWFSAVDGVVTEHRQRQGVLVHHHRPKRTDAVNRHHWWHLRADRDHLQHVDPAQGPQLHRAHPKSGPKHHRQGPTPHQKHKWCKCIATIEMEGCQGGHTNIWQFRDHMGPIFCGQSNVRLYHGRGALW